MSPRVLVVAADPVSAEVYADLVREVEDCQVQTLSPPVETSEDFSPESALGGESVYDLIVLEASEAVDPLRWLEVAKRLSPSTGVLLIEEGGRVDRAVAAIRAGAEDYLERPPRPEAFLASARRALDKRKLLCGGGEASGYLQFLQACQLISAATDRTTAFRALRNFFARELRSHLIFFFNLKEKDAGAAGGAPGDMKSVSLEPVAWETADNQSTGAELVEAALIASGARQLLLARVSAAGGAGGAAPFGQGFFVEPGGLTPGLFVFEFRFAGPAPFFLIALSPELPSTPGDFESRSRLLAAQLEVSGKNIAEYEGVQSLVYRDEVTGLYNTRYLDKVLDREIARHELTGQPFAVLFIDADRFKSVNDRHGHLIGSKLLNELGDEIRASVREKDVVFRYGGDEFVAVLSGCELEVARAVAERIRASVERKEFLRSEGKAIRFTVSIGVSLYPLHALSRREIVETADEAMYGAKRSSRNSVFVAFPSGNRKDGAA
jgi:diguanylate cyclase (GGDEF)-like protein